MGLDDILGNAVAQRDVPFVVAMTANSAGVQYSGAAGEATPGKAASGDTVFRIYSMTKAVGSVAAMILIDRGKLHFDTPVAEVLPEFAQIKLLEGFDGDKPVLRDPRAQATVRHLATHTSGLEYDIWNADVAKYLEVSKTPRVLSGLKASLFCPMTTDPGTRWGYGFGIDWLGRIVEEVDGRRIDVFVHDEILTPLGMTSTAFELDDAMTSRLCQVSARGDDGLFTPIDMAPPSSPEFYGMGHSLYSTAPDYLRFLRMVLGKGALDGVRILSEKAVSDMTADHMQGLVFKKMVTMTPAVTMDVDLFPGTRVSHSFAFLRNEEDIPGRRKAGSLGWAGICNTHYWIDPASDKAAVIMTQSLPFVEPGFMQTYEAFERAVYENA